MICRTVLAHILRILYVLECTQTGVAKSALIDWSSLKDYRFVMEVNFFGVIGVTKAFLPLVKRATGRIVNVSSIAGVSCGYPLSSAYAASKHAVEVFTSTLRQELRPWGIKVSCDARLTRSTHVLFPVCVF